MTARSADGGSREGWFVAAVGTAGDIRRVAEGGAGSVDGVALEPDSDVGVDGGGDANVGVAEEFFDHDEFDALFPGAGWRRSWKRMRRRPALRRVVVKVRVRLVGSIGLPWRG